jgi:hypothetical protein
LTKSTNLMTRKEQKKAIEILDFLARLDLQYTLGRITDQEAWERLHSFLANIKKEVI